MKTHTEPVLTALMTHLVNTPDLPDHLNRVHDIALYDSGDFPICEEEKESLHETMHLIKLLRKIPREDLIQFLRFCNPGL